ncbi:MAG: ABC transporter substrate-binding protein [Desulfamplus sp.]|nr:ABC transporter substrate-binding protein [Desulfamplus sp.]
MNKASNNNYVLTIFIIISIAIIISYPSILISADLVPEIELRNGVNAIVETLNDPALAGAEQKEAKKEALFSKAESIFDFNEFSKGALGSNWQRFSKSQQSDFSKYFARLIANTYLEKIDDENFKDLKITYLKTDMLDSTKSGIERADIQSEVFHNKITTPVHYRMMRKKGGSWKIYDVKIEGVSLVGNYREQYRTRFNDSPDKIIKEIKEKIEK